MTPNDVPHTIVDEPSRPVPIATDRPYRPVRLPVLSQDPGFEFDTSIFELILDRIEDGVYFVDRKKRIRLWNSGAEAITGFSREEIVGAPCGNGWLCHVNEDGRRLCTQGCPLDFAVQQGTPFEQDAFLQHKLGHRIPVRVRSWPLRNQHGHLVGAVEIFRCTMNEHQQEQLIEQLSQLAMLDDLTRLPNRRHFDLQLDRRIAEMNRYGWPFGVLMMDLDHFKLINDNHGHYVGDQVLNMVGRTLLANCRSLDTVARWGGEEFASIIANVREEDLLKVAEKFRTMVEASELRTPAGAPVRITISVGCAVASPHEPGVVLMERADSLLYAAKRAGRNQVRI